MKAVFFISDHGYGHIMRNLPVAEELILRGNEVTIVTGKSQAMVADQYLQGRAKYIVLNTDAGLVVHPGALAIDIESTVDTVKSNIAQWPDMIEQAARLCADVFVVDIVPWALIAAKKTGLPSFLMANFTWIEQYEKFLPNDLLKYYEDAYSMRDRVLYYDLVNVPTKKRLGRGINVGFVARPFNESAVKQIKNGYKRKIVFLSLGASNSGLNLQIDVSSLDYDFIATKAMHIIGNNVEYLDPSVQNTQDYIKASDFCISKAGWSTVSEVMLAGVPFGVLNRANVSEDMMTIAELQDRKAAVAINESELTDMGALLKKMEAFTWSKIKYQNNYKLIADLICESGNINKQVRNLQKDKDRLQKDKLKLQKDIKRLQKELSAIKTSRGFKILSNYYHMKDTVKNDFKKIFPKKETALNNGIPPSKRITTWDKRVTLINYWTSSPDICNNDWLYLFIKNNTNIKHLNIFSIFGSKEHITKFATKKDVFFSGENLDVKHGLYDEYCDYCLDYVGLSLGFGQRREANYLRFPLWIAWIFDPLIDKDRIAERVDFINHSRNSGKYECCVIAHHDNWNMRTPIYEALKDEINILCAGKWNNNTDILWNEYNDNKIKLLNNCKFTICAENEDTPYYVTEKLFEAFLGGCIPIYAGAHSQPEPDIINFDSVLLWERGNKDNNEAVINKVRELNRDKKVYTEFLSRTKLLPFTVDYVYDTFVLLREKLLELS